MITPDAAHRPLVLVVDDEPLIRIDLADMVSDLGFDVFEAANADEAISLLQAKDFAGVVTDIDMPGSMDGRKLAEVIRGRWPPCKLLVISGMHRLTTSQLPPDAVFLSKPVQPATLVRAFSSLSLTN